MAPTAAVSGTAVPRLQWYSVFGTWNTSEYVESASPLSSGGYSAGRLERLAMTPAKKANSFQQEEAESH